MESGEASVVNARVVSMSEEFRKELLHIVHSRKPGREPKGTRRGFTRRQIAKWFAVCETEVYRWDNKLVNPPIGYSETLRLSGNYEEMADVLKAYWDLRRLKGADAYSTGRLDHVPDPSVFLKEILH